ncbi:hypothetical protein Tco_1149916, partial [Tanacetum coccineum]
GQTPLEAKKLCNKVKNRMHGGNTLWCCGSYGAKEEDVANFKTKRWNCGACKQLVGKRVDLTGDEDLTDEDGDIGMGDQQCLSILGGKSLGGKKSWKQTSVGDRYGDNGMSDPIGDLVSLGDEISLG